MSIRFDRPDVLQISRRKPYQTEDGMLLLDATFARDGVLEYTDSAGRTRKELRPSEENEKARAKFGLAPTTLEHPAGLVDEHNADSLRKGISLQDVIYDKGGFVRGAIAVFDSEAKRCITSREKSELSVGYRCDVEETPGIWVDVNGVQGPKGKKYHYDAIQRNIQPNHIAITSKGRAGPLVGVHLDSLSDPDIAYQIRADDVSPNPPKRPMAKLRIDSVEYDDVPVEIAQAIAPKLKRLDEAEETISELETEVSELEKEVEKTVDDYERERGRADAQDICLTNAEIILEQYGYRRDATGNYIRADKGKKHSTPMADEDWDDEDSDDYDKEPGDDEELEPPSMKKKKGKKKMDSVRTDAKELISAFRDAETLIPRMDDGKSFTDAHLDSLSSPAEIRQKVVELLRPNLKLDDKDASYIDGVYDMLKASPAQHNDSYRADYTKELAAVVGAAGGSILSQQPQLRQSYEDNRTERNWEKPLSLSR